MPDETFAVSRRALNIHLILHVVFAGVAAYVVLGGVRAMTQFYPLSVVMSFASSWLLLFPAYRIWKQSRGRLEPRFLPFAGTVVAISAVIFALSWLVARGA